MTAVSIQPSGLSRELWFVLGGLGPARKRSSRADGGQSLAVTASLSKCGDSNAGRGVEASGGGEGSPKSCCHLSLFE